MLRIYGKFCFHVQHEYLSYMEKKTSKRQLAIVSLSDYNQKQIDDLQQEQRDLTEQFERRKEGVYMYLTRTIRN